MESITESTVNELLSIPLYTHIAIAVALTFVLSLLITWVYKKTYRGVQYSQSFVHTIIIMSIVVAVVMTVIGNNLAVAFGLVGAFSIIRFRSAMSDPKDIAYIFFGMAAGVAAGLQQYGAAVLFTVLLCALIAVITHFNFGNKEPSNILKVVVPENLHFDHMFDEVFKKHLASWDLQKIETTNLGTMIELQYKIAPLDGVKYKDIMDRVREQNANLKVAIHFS